MDHREMVALIRAGVPGPGGTWADLGAGSGNFTRALAELLGPQGMIYAVDRDARAVNRLRTAVIQAKAATIRPREGDFTRPLDLPPLDGVLMANALHFIPDQAAVLASVAAYLRPGGCLLLVEYDVRAGVGWVPFPVPFARFQLLAEPAGLSTPTLVGTRRSPSSGIVMYAAVALRHG